MKPQLIAVVFLAATVSPVDAETSRQQASESAIVTKPDLRRPEIPTELTAEDLKIRYKQAWDRYEKRVNSATHLLVFALQRFGDQTEHEGYLGRDQPRSVVIVRGALEQFTITGEITDGLSVCKSRPLFAPVAAAALLTTQEYVRALRNLEEDYAALATQLELSGRKDAASRIRQQIAHLLDGDWERQQAIISAREKANQAKREERQLAAREKKKAEEQVPRAQRDQLKKDGIDAQDLVDGKHFKATNQAGRMLNKYLAGKKWTNGLGDEYTWDDKGRLWFSRQQNRRQFIYAEYGDQDEVRLKPKGSEEITLVVDRQQETVTPRRPTGRLERSFILAK